MVRKRSPTYEGSCHALVLNVLVVAAATVLHLWLGKRPVTTDRLVAVVLLYLLVIFAGVEGVLGFLGHTFKAREIARSRF